MKRNRRMLSLVMVFCMLIAWMPALSADEVETSYDVAIGVGADAIQDRNTFVYAGQEWIVLDSTAMTNGDAGIAVISKDIADANIAFHKGGLDNAWANSAAKTWLTSYADNNFSAEERSFIVDTTKAESAGTYFGHNWSKDALAGEKLFFLSAAEVEQYFVNGSSNGLIASYNGKADGWWLRSAYTDRDIMAGIVSDSGFVGYPHVAATWGARPAFNIADSSIVLSSAAVGGKISGDVGANALTAVGSSSSNVIKLTLADSAHSNFTATLGGNLNQTIGYDSWVLPVTFSGAVAGENEYVSMLICDQTGASVYYGHIANSASGSVDVNMPVGLSGKYTVYVFAEKCNGDNATDFASIPISAEINVDDGMAKVEEWGLALQGDIRADFFMSFSDTVLADPDAYVSVTVKNATKNYKISDLEINNKGFYVVSTNVAAAQMTDIISIQTCANEIEGSVYKYTVRMYGDYIMENHFDEKVIDLVKAMLNYGGKAQDYFGYNVTDKADNGISIDKMEIPKYDNVAAEKVGSSSKVKYYGSSLVHEHQTSLRFYFVSTDADIASVTFNASLADGTSVNNLVVHKNGTMYYVEITDIAPNKLCNDITISVDGFSVTYSPFDYMHRMFYKTSSSTVMREMMSAMYNYYYYAAEYLNA